ncbi:MAG: hypothetical protein ABI885_03080 [Gammaproteobacteria bacterium]
MTAIVFKVLVAVGYALLGAAALRAPALQTTSERRFILAALGLQLIPTLALFVALYGLGGQDVTSDVPGYYMPLARAAMAGQVPFRDFPMSYAPLFPYVGAALLSVWSSAKAFALFAILLNALALVLWHAAAVASFDRQAARTSSVLFATSGHVLVQALLGTNQAWIAVALAASTVLLVRERNVYSGLVQGLALCVVKFLVLLFWPVLWIVAPRRLRWLVGALVPTALVYGAFAAGGADLLTPFHQEADSVSSGNLPYLLQPLVAGQGALVARVFDGFAILALGSAVLWLFVRATRMPISARPRMLMPALALVGLVFMLLSKKSFTGYALFFLYPAILTLVLSVRDRRWLAAFVLLFNTLLAAEPSLWFHLGNFHALSDWLATSPGAGLYGFLIVDLALVACYAYLAVRAAEMVCKISSQSATARSLV